MASFGSIDMYPVSVTMKNDKSTVTTMKTTLTGCVVDLLETVLMTVPSRMLVVGHAMGVAHVADGGHSVQAGGDGCS